MERLVRQLGQAVLESLGHRVHDACHGPELPVTLDLDAMSQTVDHELLEPELEVPERDVERPAEMSQDDHRRGHRADEHGTDEQQDPVRSVGHGGRVGDELLACRPG